MKKLASEHGRKNLYRNKELLIGANPPLLIKRQSTSRNDAMDMRMVQQNLGPCVQKRDKSDLGAEALGVFAQCFERVGCRFEQNIVKRSLVP